MTDEDKRLRSCALPSNCWLEVTPPTKRRMTADERDIETLKTHERVSIFWVTESMRRAKLMERLTKSGYFTLDNSCGYPWFMVTFNAELTGGLTDEGETK